MVSPKNFDKFINAKKPIIKSRVWESTVESVGTTICRLPGHDGLVQFTNPVTCVETTCLNEVIQKFKQVEAFTKQGYFAVGYVAYEAAQAFDSALTTKNQHPTLPLLLFYIYKDEPKEFANYSSEIVEKLQLKPELQQFEYLDKVKQVLDYIYEGDIYQANFTFRAKLPKITDPLKLFKHILSSNPVPYAGFLSHETHSMVSISPELFIEKNDQTLISKPMKGTAKRHPIWSEDLKQSSFLTTDPKNCAENLMIVDMVRNDFGRLATPGTIKVDPLFQTETYATLHQMTSTVTAKTKLGVVDIFKKTFPAASITGAPKIRATEVIKQLENSPRGIYCGAFGVITPTGNFCFNVPIRTITCHKSGNAELGIGSGIVADSVPEDEWKESLLKSTFVNNQLVEFDIFETLAWLPEVGYTDLDAHLQRLRNSQEWYKRPWLKDIKGLLPLDFKEPQRLKLILSKTGDFSFENSPLTTLGWTTNASVKISTQLTNSSDHFLYHKTTNRQVYNQAFKEAQADGFTEMLFFNEKGELTEGSISNVFIKEKDQWFTPSLSCGLLAGIERAKLIIELQAKTCKINRKRLDSADEVLICNSLRGSSLVELVSI